MLASNILPSHLNLSHRELDVYLLIHYGDMVWCKAFFASTLLMSFLEACPS